MVNYLKCNVLIVFLLLNYCYINSTATTQYGIKGHSIELICRHRSKVVAIQWYKGTLRLSNSVSIYSYVVPVEFRDRLSITGNHANGEYHLTIATVNKTDEGKYYCLKAGHVEQAIVQLSVIEGPAQVKINSKSIDSKINGTEEKDLTISCNAEGGDKTPDMILQIKNRNYTESSQRNIEHTLVEVDRQYDGTTVTCMAGYQELSYFPETDTAIIYLDLKPFKPSISPDTVSTEETKSISVTCTSSGGRPKPTVKWSIDNAVITSQSTIESSTHDTATDTYTVTSKLTYSVDRMYNGKNLSCGFKNTASGNIYVSESRTLDIKFSPSVSVGNETYNPGDMSRPITCNANGNPATYSFSKWKHISQHGTVIRSLDGNSTLTLPQTPEETRYQDTGEYVCTVSNGIKDKDGNFNQQASGYVLSLAPPVFLSEDQQVKLGQTKNDVKIQVNIYSVPKYTSLKWLKGSSVLSPSTKYTMTNASAVFMDTFHGTKVQVDGYRLTLTIHKLEEQDFVNYTLHIGNNVGESVEHLIILLSASPPETPTNFSQTDVTESSITLQWLPAYNGGHEQNFSVEYRRSGSSSWKKASVPTALYALKGDLQVYTLSGLQDGTAYEIRVYAENKFNQSNATDIIKVSTLESSGQGAVVGAVVSVLAVIVIIVVIVAVMVVRRRNDNGIRKIQRSKSASDREDGLKDNILYKSFDTGSDTQVSSEYAEVQRSNDVYAEVNKPKPQKKTKDLKPKATKSPGKKKQKQKALNNNSAAEEYANQSEYANSENPTGVYKNADGLQYADLTFSNPPKTKTGKSVIHGLDERTIYCDVDHTKKAPPSSQEGACELTEISKEKQS